MSESGKGRGRKGREGKREKGKRGKKAWLQGLETVAISAYVRLCVNPESPLSGALVLPDTPPHTYPRSFSSSSHAALESQRNRFKVVTNAYQGRLSGMCYKKAAGRSGCPCHRKLRLISLQDKKNRERNERERQRGGRDIWVREIERMSVSM